MTPIALAIVPDAPAPEDDATPQDTPPDDALTPQAILRALAMRLTSDPFACDGATVAIRRTGTALQAAISKVAAARAHLAACEASADVAASAALTLLTGG